jgi:hypothetical protein
MTLLVCSSCATTDEALPFKVVVYSYHGPEGRQEAVRSLDAAGRVEGSHLSGAASAPIVSISAESAQLQDMREVGRLVAELPPESPSTVPEGRGFLQLQVIRTDGVVYTYKRTDAHPFADPKLLRLETIMRSYRAGYW